MFDTAATIEKIQKHAEKVKNGQHEKLRPGQPLAFSPAMTTNDCLCQGDLDITLIDTIPAGYKLVDQITEKHRQLVPGNHAGAKHCLNSLTGYKMYLPTEPLTDESLDGPVLVVDKGVDGLTILHPTHGDVTLIGDRTYQITYQKAFDVEKKKARRSQD